MSEFLAEAQILVRPNTTGFRAELEAALATSLKPITIPVVPVASGISSATVQTTAFTSAQAGAAAETQAVAAALEKETVGALAAGDAVRKLTVDQTANAASLGKLERGAASSGLSLLGIRGATLAASGGFLAGAAAVTLFAKSLQSAAALETELNVFAVNAGATADQMERVSAAAKQLGRDLTLPGVTASDAAVAMTELAKAGLSVENAMAAARGTLELATAAQLDNAAAAKLVSSALNSFQLDGSQAVKVADLFAGAAKSAQGSIQDFGPALAQASAVAHAFGISIGDTVTLLTQLAKAGLEGGRAGTSLRVALLRLVNPPADAAKALKALNIQIRDANGNLRPQVFTDIEKALQGVSKAQRQATEATIFGSDAVRTQVILGQQGAKAFNAISKAVNESGLAQEQAAARTKGLTGDFQNLSNQVDALQLTVGQLASGPVKVLVSTLAATAENANLAAGGLIALGGAVGDLTGKLTSGLPVLGRYVALLELAAKIQLNPKAGIGDALSGIASRAKAAAEGLKQAVTQNVAGLRDTPGLKEFVDNLNEFIGAIEKSGPKTKAAMDKVVGAVKTGTDEIGAAAQPQVQFPVQRIQNIVQGFDAKEVRDRIAGNNAKLLADLRAEQDFLNRELARQGVKNRPALKRALEQALLGVKGDIDSILSKQAADAKAAQDAIVAAANKQTQDFLAAQEQARSQRQNAISAAAQTPGLQDDISQQQKLKRLVLAQIAAINERIKDEKVRSVAVTALKAILIQINGQLQSLAKQQQAAALEQRKNLVDSASLDVDLAQITGNKQGEINARKKLIAQLKNEQKLVGATTNEYKRLRNEIASQNEAIKALNGEKNKQKNLFAQATFEFLQTQQGFASNLLGNLIPGGATAGLVGGGSVQQALPPLANAAEAATQTGPTAGQGNVTNHILNQILQQIKQLNGRTSAPEAQQWVPRQHSVMDGVGGG